MRRIKDQTDRRPWAVVDSQGEHPEIRSWHKSNAQRLTRDLPGAVPGRYKIVDRRREKQR